MTYRIAAVSFLNTVPLIDWFERTGDERVALTRALPSRLGSMLSAGEADVALLPVVEIFRGAGAGMLAATGIACRGRVDSVKLFHQGIPGALRKVAVDRGSRTSVALLEILLKERFGISPELTVFEPRRGWRPEPGEGALIIGDRCFEYEKDLGENGDTAVGCFDLGEAWFEWTGLPFVFAAWTVAPGFHERVGGAGVRELADLLVQARDYGLANLQVIARREAAAGRLGRGGEATPEALGYYFSRSLRYVIGEQELAGLRRFHELCIQHGVVPGGASPSFL